MKLKTLREQQGLTQKQVAQKIGIPYYNYNKYELEKVNIDNKTLCQIADFYGVSLDYLCDHATKGVIDLSGFSELKKGCVYVLEKLSESNTAIVLGYMTHILQEQSK